MSHLFADSFYFLALINRRDSYHGRVKARGRPGGPITTTQAVLLEVADALADPASRGEAGEFLRALWRDARVEIVAVDDELYRRGLLLYCDRPDKGWSLTDCISFVVMEERGIKQALTADQHFAQAGFAPLFVD